MGHVVFLFLIFKVGWRIGRWNGVYIEETGSTVTHTQLHLAQCPSISSPPKKRSSAFTYTEPDNDNSVLTLTTIDPP
jgi:hypothetical protein